MRPKDFWAMHPVEFWWMLDAKRPPKMYGSLKEEEIAELYEEMKRAGVL
jgi:hypothetical protein